MENNKDRGRRQFIKHSALGTVSIGLGFSAVGSFLSSCGSSKKTVVGPSVTGFDQQSLPYAYNALEDVIDAQTMEIHYSKHAAAYSKALKEAIAAEGLQKEPSVESILSKVSKYSAKLRNNAGGHYNHEMFWKCMRPKNTDNKPSGKLFTAIESEMGSFASLKSQLTDAGMKRFGSGWAWL